MKAFITVILFCCATQTFAVFHHFQHFRDPEQTACGIFATADYLLWKAEEDQLNYAVIVTDFPTLGIPRESKIVDQRFEWSSGFRLGAGFKNPAKNIKFYLNYTRFHPKTVGRVHSTSSLMIASGLSLISNNAITTFTGSDAKSSWHLKMDMWDLEFGRRMSMGTRFYFHPHFGLKGGWINQRQEINYSNFVSNTGIVVVNAKVTRKNDFAGIGPRVGFNTHWGRELCVFGNFSAAFIYGWFDRQVKYSFNSIPAFPDSFFPSKNHNFRPTIQVCLGLDWHHQFHLKRGFSIKWSYEGQYWWKQWELVSNSLNTGLSASTTSGDLSMQGLTVEGELFF